MASFVEEAAFDSPVLFDSFEEVELHPLDRHRGLKSKRNRDGENTRVRSKTLYPTHLHHIPLTPVPYTLTSNIPNPCTLHAYIISP